MGFWSDHNDRVDEKNRAKNAKQREKYARESAVIRGAVSNRNETARLAQLAGGYDLKNMSSATGATKRQAEKDLIKKLGEKKAKKLIKAEKNRVGKEYKEKAKSSWW